MVNIQNLYHNVGSFVYRNTTPLLITGTMGAIALAVYFHPIPITRNWGDIAARDLAAKSEVVSDIKRDVAGYSADGRWDSGELAKIVASSPPRRFLVHRTEEMGPILGVFPRFDSISPSHALEDELWLTYNKYFSDGSRRFERGPLVSYHEFRPALFRELYEIFVNKDKVTYEQWLKGEGILPKNITEDNESWVLRHFNGSIDLNQTSLDEQLDEELGKLSAFFSSKQNQDELRQSAGSLGDPRDRGYNALSIGLLTILLGIATVSYLKNKARKSGSAQI